MIASVTPANGITDNNQYLLIHLETYEKFKKNRTPIYRNPMVVINEEW